MLSARPLNSTVQASERTSGYLRSAANAPKGLAWGQGRVGRRFSGLSDSGHQCQQKGQGRKPRHEVKRDPQPEIRHQPACLRGRSRGCGGRSKRC